MFTKSLVENSPSGVNAESGSNYWEREVAGTKEDPFKTFGGVMSNLTNLTDSVKNKSVNASKPSVIVNLDGNETHNFASGDRNGTFLVYSNYNLG